MHKISLLTFSIFFLLLTVAKFNISNNVNSLKCTSIDRLPFVINTPGCYKLMADFYINHPYMYGITVKSNNVILNLNSKEIRGPYQPGTLSIAIYANQVQHLEIKNGKFSGFFYGIRIEGDASKDVTVKNIIAKDNYFRGIEIEAENAIIKNNKIINTGGTKVHPNAFAFGIEVKGNNCQITHNEINGIYPTGTGEGVGISLSNRRNNCLIKKNVILNPINSHASFGIWLSPVADKTIVRFNKISGFILPFSNSRQAPNVFQFNSTKDTSCNPYNYSRHYTNINASNTFNNSNRLFCSRYLNYWKKKYKDLPDDPLIVFNMATAMFNCEVEPELNKTECCKLQKESITFFEKAISLGSTEAKRIISSKRLYLTKNCPDQ